MPQHRFALRGPFMLLFCFAFTLIGVAQNSVPVATPAGSSQFDAAAETRLVNLINQARSQQGLPPLTPDQRLTEAARKHSELMAQHSALSHEFPGEPPLQLRFSNEGLVSDSQGENVDLDQSVEGAHEVLMKSPPHRANILDPDYNVVGVGILRSGQNLYVTEDFARRLPQLSEQQAEAAVQTAIDHNEQARRTAAPVRKPLTELRHMACDMALNDSLDLTPASRLPGVHDVFAWTAGDPRKLPKGIDRLLGAGLPHGYSLGACLAPSVSHPGGIYWLVMVAY